MDQKLSDQFTQALLLRDKADKTLTEVHRSLAPLQRAWNLHLAVGDIVSYYEDKCIVSEIGDDTIEVQEVASRGAKHKCSPIESALYRPWTEADEARYQLRKRKAELATRIEQLPESKIVELEALLKSS